MENQRENGMKGTDVHGIIGVINYGVFIRTTFLTA